MHCSGRGGASVPRFHGSRADQGRNCADGVSRRRAAAASTQKGLPPALASEPELSPSVAPPGSARLRPPEPRGRAGQDAGEAPALGGAVWWDGGCGQRREGRLVSPQIFMKYGRQRWKLKGKIEVNGRQSWDREEMVFLPLIAGLISIKVECVWPSGVSRTRQ